MNCKEIQNKLIFLVGNELQETAEQLMMQHIQTCDSCSLLYHSVREAFNKMENEKKIASNPYLYTRIQQKINNQNTTVEKGIFGMLKESVVILVVAAAISIGVVVGYISKEYYVQPENNQVTLADDYTSQLLSQE